MISLPVGVVTLAERFGQGGFDPDGFEAMVDDVAARLASFEAVHCIAREIREGGVQLLGTSGTVTTLAGVALKLARYRRPLVDGTVLSGDAANEALAQSARAGPRTGWRRIPASARIAWTSCCPAAQCSPRIIWLWPAPRVIVADRGLREGMLLRMIRTDRTRATGTRLGGRPHDAIRLGRWPRIARPGGSAAHGQSSQPGASQRWLARQLNDPYVAAAKQQGWRSRAAFKLLELDDRFHLIRRGALVVDLGAAPGGWSQAAVQRGAGRVVGVDLLPVDPVTGATLLLGDFTDPAMPDVAGRASGRQGGPGAVRHGAEHHRPCGHRPSAHHGAGRAAAGISHWRCWPRVAGSSQRCSRVVRSARCSNN